MIVNLQSKLFYEHVSSLCIQICINCRQKVQIKIVVVVNVAGQNYDQNIHSQLSYLVAPWMILRRLPCRSHQFFPTAEIHTGIVLVAHPVIPQKIEQAPLAMAYSGMHPKKRAKHITKGEYN